MCVVADIDTPSDTILVINLGNHCHFSTYSPGTAICGNLVDTKAQVTLIY